TLSAQPAPLPAASTATLQMAVRKIGRNEARMLRPFLSALPPPQVRDRSCEKVGDPCSADRKGPLARQPRRLCAQCSLEARAFCWRSQGRGKRQPAEPPPHRQAPSTSQ